MRIVARVLSGPLAVAITVLAPFLSTTQALASRIGFDFFSGGTIITGQYSEATFSGDAFPVKVLRIQNKNSTTGHSKPNVIFSGPNEFQSFGNVTVDFTDPVFDLSFVVLNIEFPGIVGFVTVEHSGGTSVVDIIQGNHQIDPIAADLVDLSLFADVTRIRIAVSDNNAYVGLLYDDFTFTVVPEPSTALLLMTGLVGLASYRRGRAR